MSSECSDAYKNTPGVYWNRRQGEPSCYPSSEGSGMGYNNSCACVKGNQATCGSDDCPAPVSDCVASSCAKTQENYIPCCRPQVYVNLNQTWKKQGVFEL